MNIESLVPKAGSLAGFIEQFQVFAGAPDGVNKLREIILQLAITGRLTSLNVNDSSALMLLSNSKSIKTNYEKEFKLRKAKTISPLNEITYPYEIPKHWAWSQLDDLSCYIQRGKSPKYNEDNSLALVISQKCIQWTGFDLSKARGIEASSLDKYAKERFLIDGDLLWNSTGTGTVGRIAIFKRTQNIEIVADSHVTVIRLTNVESRYVWFCIACPWVQSRIEPDHEEALVAGSTKQVELSTASVKELPIPLPPLEEQKRIVAKVDELMALCDKLEAQQQQQANTVLRANTAAINALLNPNTPEISFEQNWQRIAQHFNTLYGCTLPMPKGEGRKKKYLVGLENVRFLRQTIIQLGISGKLIKPSADYFDLSLLKKISSTQSKKLKSSINQIDLILSPWSIRTEWKWVRLGQLVESIRYGTSKKCAYPIDSNPVLRIPNMKKGKIDFSDIKYTHLSEKEANDLSLQSNDMLIIRSNGSESLVGRSFIVGNSAGQYAYAGYLMRLRFPKNVFSLKYIHLFLESDHVRKQIEGPIRTTSGVKNINSSEIANIEIAIPSLEEQKRIVVKVDQLMTLCDQLEQQLTQSYNDAEKLMQATVKALVA